MRNSPFLSLFPLSPYFLLFPATRVGHGRDNVYGNFGHKGLIGDTPGAARLPRAADATRREMHLTRHLVRVNSLLARVARWQAGGQSTP